MEEVNDDMIRSDMIYNISGADDLIYANNSDNDDLIVMK